MSVAALQWYLAKSLPADQLPEQLSPTRDVFQARLDRFYKEALRGGFAAGDASLLTAVCGEIGNNCFDHNLGQWKDQPGCRFEYEFSSGSAKVVLSDRGQGILASLKRAKPDLRDDAEALKTAFEKTLSGRHPEQRGNGLKFVRSVINQNTKRGLLFGSGRATILFGGRPVTLPGEAGELEKMGTGTLAILEWKQ
ncbi:MAG: hypothetical protein Q7T11_07320 [Deltaproteobacteria bacterium]|nr:hypothetical protein [Deltaproteobacteria bacterium]